MEKEPGASGDRAESCWGSQNLWAAWDTREGRGLGQEGPGKGKLRATRLVV